MKRLFDLSLSVMLLVVLLPFLFFVSLLIKMTSRGPVFYVSARVGINNNTFRMYKFRTMKADTPPVATHLMTDPDQFLTPIGNFLRKTSLDEFPQLINILKGDMSFVGPRPALFNQDDLIKLRTEKGIHKIIPGLTGWAQIMGRDELPIPVKVDHDEYYLKHSSFLFDLNILWRTYVKVLWQEGVDH